MNYQILFSSLLTDDNIIQLGKKDFMMNLIPLQPKQESTRLQEKEANVFGVLKDRLAHSGIHDQQILVKLEKFFKQKKGINLKKFRIRVDFYLDRDCQVPLIVPHMSNPCDEIKDTGNLRCISSLSPQLFSLTQIKLSNVFIARRNKV